MDGLGYLRMELRYIPRQSTDLWPPSSDSPSSNTPPSSPDCHETLKTMTSLSEPLICLETLVSIIEPLTVFLLVKLTLYVVLIPSPIALVPSPVYLVG